jgi:uncharacterized protein YndB with AHSA1/START domain
MNIQNDGGTATGFTLTRVLSGTPSEVFAHFIEPELFSRWFIVEASPLPLRACTLTPGPAERSAR